MAKPTTLIAWTAATVLGAAAGFVVASAVLDVRAQEVDINAIFSCEAGKTGSQSAADCASTRNAILQNCTSCHTFVPIVKAQKSPDEWDAVIGVHRERLPDMADDQFGQIRTFLVAHFNPSNPPPTLPPELEALGTQQAN
jgi:hypothetical protein